MFSISRFTYLQHKTSLTKYQKNSGNIRIRILELIKINMWRVYEIKIVLFHQILNAIKIISEKGKDVLNTLMS